MFHQSPPRKLVYQNNILNCLGVIFIAYCYTYNLVLRLGHYT